MASETLNFVGDLPDTLYDELEHMLFFNARQKSVRPGIEDAIERFGVPDILREADRIRVTMASCPHSQCLFATVDTPDACELLGVALYMRDAPDAITVLHVAVSDDIVADDGSNLLVGVRLVQKIREVGQCLRGVKWVRLLYPGYGQQQLPVARGTRSPISRHVRGSQMGPEDGRPMSRDSEPSLNTQTPVSDTTPSGPRG